MRRLSIIIAVIFTLLLSYRNLSAAPRSVDEAEMIVKGWLKVDSRPLGAALGRTVMKVDTFTDDTGEPLYYIVYLEPTGFVIVSADDLVEPVIGFADKGVYDPSFENPLGVLVTNDLKGRTTIARSTFDLLSTNSQSAVTKTQQKWNYLMGLGAASEEGFSLMTTLDSISDVCVEPLVKSYWGTEYSCGFPCYNYYTPYHYSCGYAAATMAQIMRYHQYPVEPNEYDPDEADGRRRYWIYVNGIMENSPRFLKGGDDSGGSYKWELMPNLPGCGNSTEQRQAVGSICYDAGISINTRYYSNGTAFNFLNIREAFLDVFNYSNAIDVLNYNSDSYLNIDKDDLVRMVNPNLDAGNPVILAIINSNVGYQHIVICDGYGYNVSTMYHHLNMGWDFLPIEYRNVWYELPDISDYCEWVDGRYRYWFEYNFNTICGCIYNIFTSETGEIISGRVVDADGMPIEGVEITTHGPNGVTYNQVTNENGIYALKGLESNSTYAISADKTGFNFNTIVKSTGKSEHGSSVCGNKWGADFVGSVDSETVVIGSGSYNWNYPMHTEQQDSRTQVIYLAEEIGRSGNITSMALYVTKIPGQVLGNWTIRMKHTGMNEYDSDNYSLDNDGWTLVYQNNESIVDQGWHSFEFQTPFEYNGIDNLLIDLSHNNSSATENGECRVSNAGRMRSVYACSNSTANDPLNWPSSPSPVMHISSYVPNVKLTLGTASHEIIREIKLTALDGEPDDRFGCSVSLSGDYAIVGAYKKDNNCGAAYIFKREGTNWIQQVKLRDITGDKKDYFGSSVSINEDYVIIGAEGGSSTDFAYIYKREGNTWTKQVKLNFSSYGASDYFGPSVSIDGDYAIIGAMLGWIDESDSRQAPGVTYIFNRGSTGWSQQAVLEPLDNASGNLFGSSTSICGDYAVVGANGNSNNRGSAYIFKRTGTSWEQKARLTAGDGAFHDEFGSSASISGDYVIVGAPYFDDGIIGTDSGSAYIFKRGGNNWTQHGKLNDLEGAPGDHFGTSVSIDGDYVIIGSPYYDNEIHGRDSGSVYIFKRNGARWDQQVRLTSTDGAYDDHFGYSVAIDGYYVIVGAEGDDDNGRNSGSAYIYRRTNDEWLGNVSD